MRLVDLAQAIPGIVVAVLLTGYSLATLLAPSWPAWERLAAAPGLAAGFLGVLGLGMRLVHIPFEPQTVLPIIGGLAVAGFVRRRRAGPPTAAPERRWWFPVPALLAGAVGAAMFVIALHNQVLPPDWDSAAHGGLANGIAQTHDVLPLIPVPLEGTQFARSRPGFEAMAAVVSWVGGPPPAQSMAPVVTVTLVLLPLGLAMLALEATGSLALAVLAPLFAIGLAFPADQAILGRFPQVVDSTLVVPLLVAGLRLVRGLRTADNALLIAAAVAAIWVVHGLEVLTALVVGGALLAAVAVRCLRRAVLPTILRAALAVAAAAAGALVVTVLTRLPHVPPPAHPEPSAVATVAGHLPVHPREVVQLFAQTDLISPVAVALFCAGVAAMLIRRRMLWVLVAEVALLLAMVDNLYLHRLASLWRTLYPWGDVDRLLGVQYWLVPLVLAGAVVALAAVMRTLARPPRRQVAAWVAIVAGAVLALLLHGEISRAWSSLFTSPPVNLYPLGAFDRLAPLGRWSTVLALAAAALGVAWIAASRGVELPAAMRSRWGGWGRGLDAAAVGLAAVAMVSLAVGARADLSVYDGAVTNRALVTPADLAVLNAMTAALPRGALVLTDGNDDAGMWMAAVTDLTPLVPNGFEGGPLGTPLVVALAHACSDPIAAAQALRHADAVFVGAHRLPAAQHPWNVGCIARLPGLRLISSQSSAGTEAAAFAVAR